MSFTDDYLALRKKKKKEEETEKTTTAPLFTNKTTAFFANDDIAPVSSVGRLIYNSAGNSLNKKEDIAPVTTTTKTQTKTEEELLDSMTPAQRAYHNKAGGFVDTSTSWADKVSSVTDLILSGGDADYTETDKLLKQLKAQQERNDKSTSFSAIAKSTGENAELQRLYNSLITAKHQDILSKTTLDGTDRTVLEEMQLLAEMESGEEKDKRKAAVLKKMEELGINTANYALFTDDKNFTWDNFWGWLENSSMAGLNSFNKGIASTADLILGKPLQALGWENNPISLAKEYYDGTYEAYETNRQLYTERLGGGGGWQFAGDAVEGTTGAIPQAVLALMSMGASAGATSSSLTQKAIYEAGNFLTKAGLTVEGMMKNPQYWLSFVRTCGTDYEQAKEMGASDEVAVIGATLTSLINAGLEIGTDGTSGIQGLPDDLADGGSKLLAWTIAGLEEGGEEGMQKFITEAVTKAMYNHEADILNPEEYAKEMAIGALSGWGLGAGQTAVVNSVNAIQEHQANKLTDTEQKVIDKIVDEAIAKEEENGKVTNKRKTEIYNNALDRMAKGYINIDTIEDVLGDKAGYDSLVQEANEFNALYTMESGKMTRQQQVRLAELEAKNETNPYETAVQAAKDKVSQDVFSLVQNSRLAESYNERARRGQTFEADLTQYDVKQREVVQKAIDSGILNNTNRTHEFVDIIAKISADKGVPFDFANNEKIKESGFAIEGMTVDGYITEDGITINIDSPKAWQSTVGHEITHVLEGTDFYDSLRQTIFDYAKSKGEYQSRYDAIVAKYKEGTDYEAELTADLVGDYLFQDADFVKHLSANNRNVFQKIYDEIKYLYKIATAGSTEARELEKVKKAFDEAYRADSKKQSDTRYSLSAVDAVMPTSGKWARGASTDEVRAAHPTLYAVDETATEKRNPTQVKGTIGSYRNVYNLLSSEGFNGTILDASSGLGYGTKAGIEEYGFNVEDIEPYPDKNYKPQYTDYSTLDKTYDVVISNAVLNVLPQDQRDALVVKMGELLNPGGRMFVNVRGKDVLNASGKIAINESNMEYFIPRTAKTGSYQKGFTKPELKAYLEDALGDGFTVTPTNTFGAVSAIVTKDGGVKYSLSDSDGKQLSQEQQEFFKDSKMRDESGNLKVMYHGSQDAGFHVFDAQKSDDNTSFFFVDRNDVAASYSGTSETYEARTIRSTEDMNNFLAEIGYDHYSAVEKNGKFELLENNEHVAWSDTAQGIYDEFCWYEGVGEGDANYKVYLNLKNPLIVDAEGRNWNNISREYSQEVYDRYQGLTDSEKTALAEIAGWGEYGIFKDEILSMARAKANGKYYDTELASAYEKIGGANANLYDAFSIASDNFSEESIKEFAVNQMNTRDYAKRAKEQGYDGVIFKNIVDTGGYSNGSEGASTVAIAFDSNQIKSVANAQPTADADIRYSLSEDTQGRKLSKEQQHYFQYAKTTDEQGRLKPFYHGTARADRVGNVFDPDRATSGPMAFFTDNRQIADNYARDKADTSLAYDEAYDDYYTQFRIDINGKNLSVSEAWNYLPASKKAEIREKAKHVKMDDDYENVIYDETAQYGVGGFDAYTINMHKGNILEALTDSWLESGTIYGEEQLFLDVLKMVGLDNVQYMNPDFRDEKTYEVYLNITNPFDTADISEEMLGALRDAAEKADYTEGNSADMWDKRNISPEQWISRLEDDIKNGTTHVWTSIPDFVTGLLKSRGYDGIFDTGGKNGGALHTVAIPFYSEQIKNTDNLTPSTDHDIRRSLSNKGEQRNQHGNIYTPANELRYNEPVQEDIAPTEVAPASVEESVTTTTRNDLAEIAKQARRENFRGAYTLDGKQYLSDGSFVAEFNTADETLEQNADFPAKRALKELDEAYGRQMPGNYDLHASAADGYVKVGDSLYDARYVNALIRAIENPVFTLSNVRGGDNALLVSGDNGRALLMPVRASDNVNVAYEAKPIDVATFPDDLAPVEQELELLEAERAQIYSALESAIYFGTANEVEQLAAEYDSLTARIRELEKEISETNSDRLDSLDDADAPPEMEAPYYEEDNSASIENPFAGRDEKAVGSQKVKAYQYENPEVKPFFLEAAYGFLYDVNNSTHGEKLYNDQVYYDSGGEEGWIGIKRHTTDDIADLKDTYGYTWDQLKDAANDIIEDNGRENNAISKRIEFLLNDRLLYGYTDVDGRQIPANEEYKNFVKVRNINEYSKEAFDRFMETADQYAPADDVAPVDSKVEAIQHTVESLVEELYPDDGIAPTVKTSKGGEVVGQQATYQEAIRNESDKVANIVIGKDKSQPKKQGAFKWAQEHVFRHGAVFEDLALETDNRELQARFDNIRRAESRAQTFIGKGKGNVSALLDVRKAVEDAGKTEAFNYYLYHLHNVDRMTLEQRFKDTPNKPVFGDPVTADESRVIATDLAKENPEFRQYAQEIYGINKYLRGLLVENGIISRETAKLWETMYPHYVPISRVDHDGLNINVPLDTKRTGVNAPIKKATGGNGDIYDVFDTMASRIEQTYKAIAKNRFGVELKNTLGTAIESEAAGDIDAVLDSVDQHEELLQEGKKGKKPTFTVFEDGMRVKFEITDEMYEAMKPSQYTWTNDTIRKINNARRNILTTYSPTFMLTNPIKDIGDIIVNSQHPARTYAAIPEAIKQIATKGRWHQERMENGGDQDTYFDSQTKTFKGEKSQFSKIVGFPFEKIQQANEIIEQVPRLAEYIASRKMGRSIDVSMLDAARVTTNFGAAGDFTNMLNRNGFTFLGASVEGFNQQVRNVKEAKAEGLKGWGKLAAKYLAAGLPALLLNHALWDDDDEYEELSDYVKQNYYIVGKFGDGQFIRIPKGRAVAVIQNAFEQMENLITGNDKVDLEAFGELFLTNLAPNNPMDNNLIAPVLQAATNTAWYGDDIVPTRLQDMPTEEQYDETTDAISRWLGENLDPLGFGPYKINYLLDQYSGGVGDMVLPYLTPESDGGGLGSAFKDKFTSDSVMNNQNVSDFYDLKDKLAVTANGSAATDEDKLMAKYINSINTEVSELYAKKREIQNSNLSDAEKQEQVREVQKQIVDLMKEGMGSYQDISYENDYIAGGEYARVGDRLYKLNKSGEWEKLDEYAVTKYEVTKAAGDAPYATDGTNHYRWYVKEGETEGEWRKITEDQLEKQEKVTNGLGITPEEYWGKKDEYDYAYEYPENYAVAKAVGGYDSYKTYSSELYDIKADKDSNGKSISGSRKEKVIDYINNLDADYGEKIILFKSEYNADDTYNYEIIDYLNSREDISYEEMETILKKLGFNVSSDGTITWD